MKDGIRKVVGDVVVSAKNSRVFDSQVIDELMLKSGFVQRRFFEAYGEGLAMALPSGGGSGPPAPRNPVRQIGRHRPARPPADACGSHRPATRTTDSPIRRPYPSDSPPVPENASPSKSTPAIDRPPVQAGGPATLQRCLRIAYWGCGAPRT